MPGHGHCRPKDNSKEPEEDNNERDRMPDDFYQSTSGPKKNRRGSQANKQWEFTTYAISETLSAFRLVPWFRLSRHAREHIDHVSAMQSSIVPKVKVERVVLNALAI
jgi:hypothetical protein